MKRHAGEQDSPALVPGFGPRRRAPTNTSSLAGLKKLAEGGIPFARFALGYEGLLVDNHFAPMSVFDDEKGGAP